MSDPSPEEVDVVREAVRQVVGDRKIARFRDRDLALLWRQRFETKEDLLTATSEQLALINLPAALIAHLKAETRAEQPLPEYLQHKYGVDTKLDYLDSKYGEAYRKARPAQPGYRGRLPSSLRSLDKPFVREVEGHDGIIYPVELGRQVELICRSHMVRAAISFFAEIECNFIFSSGNDTGLTRSAALMALIGAPGTGKTTALTELVHLMREHIESHRGDCLTIIRHATGRYERAEDTLQRLHNAVSEGKELVCWLRLDKDASLLALEMKAPGPGNILALRLLYGFLTYFDSLGDPQSPVGTYEDFLVSLDRRVRGALKPEDAFAFLDRMTGQMPDTPRAVFVLMDDFNAATGPFPNDVPTGKDGLECSWAQRLMSTLIHYTDNQPTRSRLVLPLLGTSRHSAATLAGTSTRSEIAPLPLDTPLVRDVQRYLRGVWGRALLTLGGMERPCRAIEDEDSVVVQLASWAGGNFQLMAWMLQLFGGARTVYDHKSWRAEKLADWLCAEHACPAVRSVLEALRGGMERQSWFDKLGTVEFSVKLAILQRAIAHARTGVTVQLRAPVLRKHPRITWGDLLNEGLIQPMFLFEVSQDERRQQPIVRVAESPERIPVVEARGSRAWHDNARHGDMPGFSDERAPGPSGGPGLQPPATPAAGAAGEVAPSRTSPVMATVTALGYRRVMDSRANLSAADITVDLAPAVMAGLWRGLGDLDMSPLAETMYQESSAKKEWVDLFCMMHPMYLRRKELCKTHCRLVEVVRADWLPPWAAALRVALPEPRVLEDIASFNGQLKPESFRDVRAVARAASQYKEGDSWPDLEKRAQRARLSRPAVGISAADNYGADALLFLKLWKALALGEDDFLDIFIQSKYTRGMTTQSFPYALGEAKKDTRRHNITVGEAPSVAALEGPEEPCTAKRSAPRRAAAEKGEQQRRRDSDQGHFPGGSMDDFEAAVLAAPMAHLEAWEEQLEQRGMQPPDCPNPFLYCFVTDHTMLPLQHARLRVLSLAGHPYASRMAFIDRNQQKTFYGTAIATQRSLVKLQEN